MDERVVRRYPPLLVFAEEPPLLELLEQLPGPDVPLPLGMTDLSAAVSRDPPVRDQGGRRHNLRLGGPISHRHA